MKIYSRTDIGKKRSINQDAYYVGEFDDGSAFAIVCDGMGGHMAGDIASERAISVISDYIKKSYSPKMNSSAVENLLRAAVDSANTEIYDLAHSSSDFEGMGTTVVIAFVIGNLAHIIHVGDSRAYLLRAEEIEQLTTDHSIVQAMLLRGEISEDEAKTHPRKNVIYRALGIADSVMCDYNIALKPENVSILLCSDGLSNLVEEHTLLETFKTASREDFVSKIVDLANEAGGTDNITAVLIS